MSLAKITTIGFENYMNTNGDSLFSNIELPSGIDKDTLVNTILLDSGEFEVIYSNPDFYKMAITLWSKKWYRTFKRWIDALNIEYNPIDNYDRKEEWMDESEGTSTGNADSTLNGNSQSDTKVASYDSDQLHERDQVSDNTNSHSISSTSSNAKTTNKRSGRAHGNIGVTTTQQMLTSELELAKFNIYQQIADVFANEMTIMVYE